MPLNAIEYLRRSDPAQVCDAPLQS